MERWLISNDAYHGYEDISPGGKTFVPIKRCVITEWDRQADITCLATSYPTLTHSHTQAHTLAIISQLAQSFQHCEEIFTVELYSAREVVFTRDLRMFWVNNLLYIATSMIRYWRYIKYPPTPIVRTGIYTNLSKIFTLKKVRQRLTAIINCNFVESLCSE